MAGYFKNGVAKKIAMALSGLFLVIFLLQHLIVNFTSVISAEIFNNFSHFMGTNFVVQAILQPILAFAVVFHFVMGFILEYKNRNARSIKYVSYKGNKNSTWVSRNMLFSGLVVLAFLGLHFYDFWFPELAHKYLESHPENPSRYYPELVAKFQDPWRVILYVISFVFLMLHLLHGFASSFQSMGWSDKYAKKLQGFSKFYPKGKNDKANKSGKGWGGFTQIFSIVVPLGFIFIALFHYFS